MPSAHLARPRGYLPSRNGMHTDAHVARVWTKHGQRMANTLFRHWPPQTSEFRLACEECHKRKIRCEPASDGNRVSCEACQTNQRLCLFSLRSKTGRPRKAGPEAGGSSRQRQRPLSGPSAGTSAVVKNAEPPDAFQPLPPTPKTTTTARPELLIGCLNDGDQPPVTNEEGQPPPWVPRPQTALALSLHSPPATSDEPVFQDFDMQDDDLFTDMLNSAYTLSTLHESSCEPGYTTEPTTTAASSSNSSSMLQAQIASYASPQPGNLELGDSMRGMNQDIDPQLMAQAGGTDFSDALRLCSEIYERCQSRPLDLLAESDKDQVDYTLGTIEELGRELVAEQQRQSDLSSPISATAHGRQSHYKSQILHIVVAEAIEIASSLVECTLQRHCASAVLTPQDYFGATEPDSANQNPALARNTGIASPRVTPGQRNTQLDGCVALFRLDYSLSQLRLFISGQDACHKSKPCSGGSVHGLDGVQVSCQCHGSTMLRVGQVRERVWTLIEKLRGDWR
ncbi:uncharacterized protein E0L32_002125 [Thyridium curvatum]|uniref:Zn(2)-C6 fungal-type domain-containing protein n=1 Tax=Thyridium curvatum TaxID=1093900 RepID=A0A507AE06_9PEZI|nr:uncharacterized protein E0L32_002008 [Thyridium curvatum]XP_030989233.1 uncharacterized protein E0L32_002125 [Thyridium curvatum]TPX07405.1 hypothetical protein E0L32_002008 [Thyridium curvatum]TPX07522.1 hypothetical protein E0L32_002125 [Thyridium curvatum]